MHGDPILSDPIEDPVDAAVRAFWLEGTDIETPRLLANLQSRLGSPVPTLRAIPGSASEHTEHTEHTEPSPRTNSRFRGFSLRYTLSALCLGVVLLLIATWRISAYRVTTTIATSMSIYTTASGERATITLPDGSTVVLSTASRLEVPANYATGDRAVRLTGAALFTVVPHTSAPFTVTAGSSTTRVLGTSFVVRRYPKDTTTLVAVRDGKVVVQRVVVSAKQQAIIYDRGVPKLTAATPGQFTFASNVLTLESQLLVDAIPELNRWYNADIQLGDIELNTRRIDGQFSVGSVGDLAELLELTFDIRAERRGRTLTLYSR